MNRKTVRVTCPSCRVLNTHEFDESSAELSCHDCDTRVKVMDAALDNNQLVRCLVCPSTELFVRKNFPQRLGVAIVVLGFGLSCWAWYHHMIVMTFAILMVTALIDVLLFALVGEVLECYRCHAQYVGITGMDEHEGFDLEIHEKHRQQMARLSMSASETGRPA